MTVYGSAAYGTGIQGGRISAALKAAQESRIRECALKLTIIDEQTNDWGYWAGATIGGNNFYQSVSGASQNPLDIRFWGYRGQASICKLSNGNIIRARVGDGTAGDRQIYVQTITDPTVASQWTTWGLLYAGDHFSVTVAPASASTYTIFHARDDGLYKDNVLVYTPPAGGKAIGFVRVISGAVGQGWVAVLKTDLYDGQRVIDYYYSGDISLGSASYDPTNYRWNRPYLASLIDALGYVSRIHLNSLYFNPREGGRGISAWMTRAKPGTPTQLEPPRLLRGLGGGAGFNYYVDPYLTRFSDGFYYLFMGEVHQNEGSVYTADLEIVPIWMRSKDLKYWSEPVVGPGIFNTKGFAGVVEHSGYLWWADNGQVWNRPMGSVSIDISDYVPAITYTIPRDNQIGTGKFTASNPDGINDSLLFLTDREIKVEHGLRVASGAFEYGQFNRYWITKCNREMEGAVNRIEVSIGDLLARMDNPLRDTHNFVGRTDWIDWGPGRRNQLFNWFFNSDTNPHGDGTSLVAAGLALYAGWKGINSYSTVSFRNIGGATQVGIVARYIDNQNYLLLERDGPTLLKFYKIVAGVRTLIDTVTVPFSTNPRIGLKVEWNFYRFFYNYYEYFGNLGGGSAATQFVVGGFEGISAGYVGFNGTDDAQYTTDYFEMNDIETPLIMEDLARTALAMADIHDVSIGGADDRAYSLVWGPQTDIQSPLAGLKQVLTTEKLQIVWRNGRIEIGQFNDPILVDALENEIINTDQTEEAARRINLAVVDGNEHSWIAVDVVDQREKDRSINAYFDLPELLDQDAVKKRAREEIKRGTLGSSPGGDMVMLFDLFRMDWILWIDAQGTVEVVRIEGFSVNASQGKQPFQRMSVDTSFEANPTDIWMVHQ